MNLLLKYAITLLTKLEAGLFWEQRSKCPFCNNPIYTRDNDRFCINCSYSTKHNKLMRAIKNGYKILCTTVHEYDNIMNEYGEEHVREIFKPAKNEIVIDIGAHLGEYTIPISKLCKEIIAIEPNPDTFALLTKSILINEIRNATLYNVALGDTNCQANLEISPTTSGMSKISTDKLQNSTMVNLTTLDALLANANAIHWMKIDVEGYEMHVLKGATQTILNNLHHIKIIVECHSDELKSEVIKYLKDLGMSITTINPTHILVTKIRS